MRKTWCVEVDTLDQQAVTDAVITLIPAAEMCLSSVASYKNGVTVVQHWCNQEHARKAAEKLVGAGFAARVEPNPPG